MIATKAPQVDELTGIVQQNCHISDAHHGRDYSMCIYLLKMREYYRWEMGYGYTEPLPKDELGEWLTAREELWDSILEAPYNPLSISGHYYEPFENERINQELNEAGLIYSGGLATFSKPSFFLGELKRLDKGDGPLILIGGKEYARDLTASPAMSLANMIFVRRESLRRMIWERIEEWQWNRKEPAMARALACYDFENHTESALDSMTENETESVIYHELGEVMAGEMLGSQWEEMLSRLVRGRMELIARAIRDHIADCTVTLPKLIAEDAEPSLHFYFANLRGMRRAIFPRLISAYNKWQETGSLKPLKETVSWGANYWLEKGQMLIEHADTASEEVWQSLETELLPEELKKKN